MHIGKAGIFHRFRSGPRMAYRLLSGEAMRFSLLTSAILLTALSACSSTTLTATDAGGRAATPEGGATPDGGSDANVEAGPLLYAFDGSITKLNIDHVSLGAVPGCFAPYLSVDYDRAIRTMSWGTCASDAGGDASDAGPYGAPVTRVLSSSEAQEVENLLATVTYQNNPPCGGEDGGEYYLSTYDDAGNLVRKYSAQNINCYGYPAAPLIAVVYDEFVKLRG